MKLKIISNPKKDWAKALASELADYIAQNSKHETVNRGADITICIGGDGTILYAGHRGRIEGTILGIGAEKSYICQLRRDSWKERVLPLLESGRTEKIMTLECRLGQKRYRALNDVVIHATHYRVAEMDVSYETQNTRRETQFEGDGMIISTALGSSAYAFSAGGEKMGPIERKLSLVPICPYKRTFSPQVLPEDSKVEITAGSDCAFIIDGVFVRRLKKGERAFLQKGPDMVFLFGVGHYD